MKKLIILCFGFLGCASQTNNSYPHNANTYPQMPSQVPYAWVANPEIEKNDPQTNLDKMMNDFDQNKRLEDAVKYLDQEISDIEHRQYKVNGNHSE